MIETLETIRLTIHRWRAAGFQIGFTNGCFDILHAGHASSVSFAKSLCDRLIVGVDSDLSVSALKGWRRPIMGALDRARLMSALKAVDSVVIFEAHELEALVTLIRPDVMVKGAEYRDLPIVGAEHARRIVYAPMSGESTTDIIARIQAS